MCAKTTLFWSAASARALCDLTSEAEVRALLRGHFAAVKANSLKDLASPLADIDLTRKR
jgi:hypothetical protein